MPLPSLDRGNEKTDIAISRKRLCGEIHTKTGIERVENGIFRAGEIEVNLQDLD